MPSKKSLRDEAKKWTCNQLALANDRDDTPSLLRKMADTVDELGPIEIFGLTYSRSDGLNPEVVMSLYYSFSEEEPRATPSRTAAKSRARRR
jgi:hypothetical protein